jgi:hypothetical protein
MFFSISALLEKAQAVQSKQPNQAKQPKVHDYTRQQQGKDYCFGDAPNEISAKKLFYMTGIGDGIQPKDHILLKQNSETVLYQVVEVDHYSNVKSLWIALLTPVNY